MVNLILEGKFLVACQELLWVTDKCCFALYFPVWLRCVEWNCDMFNSVRARKKPRGRWQSILWKHWNIVMLTHLAYANPFISSVLPPSITALHLCTTSRTGKKWMNICPYECIFCSLCLRGCSCMIFDVFDDHVLASPCHVLSFTLPWF